MIAAPENSTFRRTLAFFGPKAASRARRSSCSRRSSSARTDPSVLAGGGGGFSSFRAATPACRNSSSTVTCSRRRSERVIQPTSRPLRRTAERRLFPRDTRNGSRNCKRADRSPFVIVPIQPDPVFGRSRYLLAAPLRREAGHLLTSASCIELGRHARRDELGQVVSGDHRLRQHPLLGHLLAGQNVHRRDHRGPPHVHRIRRGDRGEVLFLPQLQEVLLIFTGDRRHLLARVLERLDRRQRGV